MAKEYIELEPGNEYGVISLNKNSFFYNRKERDRRR